jgi:G:T/U-mismatch repair DNA glycosylase
VHPYGTFIPKGAHSMLIGSFPIGKFSDPRRKHEIKSHEIGFFFGGEKNLLWKLLGDTFGVSLKNKNDIVAFLKKQKLGVGDVIRSCVRRNGKASDKDLLEIEWNIELLDELHEKKIRRLYFTSKGVERWFYRLFPEARDEFEAIVLISPSAQSARGLGGSAEFKKWRKKNPNESAYQFILKSYKDAFLRSQD